MEGSGTIEDPYLIYSGYDLLDAKYMDYSHFKQMKDIDLNNIYPYDYEFELFDIFGEFYGVYNGQGFTINRPLIKQGSSFFGSIGNDGFSQGKILNVSLTNVYGYGFEQATFVTNCNGGEIRNCHATGLLDSTDGVLAGFVLRITGESLIVDCSFEGELVGGDCTGFSSYVSGGINGLASIRDCSNRVVINSSYAAAGAFGVYEMCLVANFKCHCEITNQGDNAVSGFISQLGSRANTNYCRITGFINSNGPVGGFIYTGGADAHINDISIITQCAAELTITANTTYGAVGGFIGMFDVNRNLEITSCFSRGSISVVANPVAIRVGGFIGDWSGGADGGIIDNCFAGVSIDYSGNNRSYVGGFIGLFVDVNGTIDFGRCYSAGNITSNSLYTGGFSGGVSGGTPSPAFDIEGPVYWDMELSGYSTSFGGTGVVGKTTAQMQSMSGYAGFDFATVWMMPEATESYKYAVLQWYYESPSENINIKILALLSENDADDHVIYEINSDSATVSTEQSFTVVLLNDLGKIDSAFIDAGGEDIVLDDTVTPIILGVVDDENSSMTGFRGVYASNGVVDAGGVVLLNSAGKISPSMMYISDEPFYEEEDLNEYLLLSIESEEDADEGVITTKHFGINYSRGVQDAAKVVILDKNGKINPSMLG